jgi:hypothetical protein
MAYKRNSPSPIIEGGTGAQTLTGVVTGNGTSALTANTVTQYGTVIAGASNAVSSVAPSATSGVPYISQGNAANPVFGTALIAGGGTGSITFNTTGVVISGATTTTALASITLTDGQLAIGSSAGNPAAGTISAGTGIAVTNGHNTISIAATGAVSYTPVNHGASPYTVLAADDFIGVDCSGGVVSILLPNAPTTGRTFSIKDTLGNAATNNITVTTVGGAVNIDGATSFVMNTAYQSINVIFNGAIYCIY